MSQLKSLLWKEWVEVRPFFAISVFIFLGLPLIGAIESYMQLHRFEMGATDWVYLLGGVMSVVIGVGVVVRDMNGRLEEFWRSRPVSVIQWILTKYFVGLAVVQVTLILPLLADISINRIDTSLSFDPRTVLAWNPYLWIAAFSLSFAIACVIRRGAHAAMLSIAILLLLYFLPQIIPPISFLSVNLVMERGSHAVRGGGFAIGMLSIGAIGLAIALLAVRRDWHMEADRKMIYWSIGGALLILFSSAAFQVASNLPLLAKTSRPHMEDSVRNLFCDGANGIMLGDISGPNGNYRRLVQPFRLTDAGIELDPAIEISEHTEGGSALWRPEHPDILYFATVVADRVYEPVDVGTERTYDYVPRLAAVQLLEGKSQTVVQSFPELTTKDWPGMAHYAHGDRLFMFGRKMLTFDISDPLKPRHILTTDAWTPQGEQMHKRGYFDYQGFDQETYVFALPQAPQLPARQRLEMFASRLGQGAVLSGDRLIFSRPGRVVTYRLEQLTDELATFRKAGRCDATPVEQMFGSYTIFAAAAGNRYYEVTGSGQLQVSRVTVFDISSDTPRPIGHFAFPNERYVFPVPLPNGRLLVAGADHLYLLGPPPKHE